MKIVRLLAVCMVSALLVISCSGSGGDDGPCKGVSCSNHGTCVVNEAGERSCECEDGYRPSFLMCIKITGDPCLTVDCGDHGSCVDDGSGNASCNCDAGYHAEGLNCIEDGPVCDGVDCGEHGTCADDGTGNAMCNCDAGYHAEGLTCVEDSAACDGVDCGANGTCADDGTGSPMCNCDAGYHAEGLTCVEDSAVCDGVDCGANGSCIDDGAGAPMCECDAGYHADGLTCVADSAACDGVDCGANGSCVDDGTGNPMCECDAGYHADGLTCVEDSTGGGYCQERCEADADCQMSGMDVGLTCQSNRCAGSGGGCTVDEECIAMYAGWATECTNGGGECVGQVCIDIGGGIGRCAMEPTYMPCADMSMQEFSMPAIDGSGNLAVCGAVGADTAVCLDEGYCFKPCQVDGDCQYQPGYPHCNPNSGYCECSQDSDCADNVDGTSICDVGVCKCSIDADCTPLATADVCNDGFCGCSAVEACTGATNYDNTVWVCE